MATVLLVDDEKDTADALKMFFDIQGVTCWVASNSDQALKLLVDQKPDVVFLDIRLEGSRLDGFGVLEEARKLPIQSKIYMVTGYHESEKEARSKEMGANGYLTKPLAPDKMMEIIRTHG